MRLNQPTDLGDMWRELEARVRVLETATRLPNFTTTAGGIQTDLKTQLEGTSSTSYTDLSTVGPTVTVNVSALGKLIAIFSAQFFGQDTAPLSDARMALEITHSDGSVTSATDDKATGTIEGHNSQHSLVIVYTVAPGTTIVKAKYKKVGSGPDPFFDDRYLVVIPL